MSAWLGVDTLLIAAFLAGTGIGYLAGRPVIQRRRYRLSRRAWLRVRFPYWRV